MGETKHSQPIEDMEFQSALSEAANDVNSFVEGAEQRHGNEIAVREHFGGLESAETVRKANNLYREFVEERGYDPHPTLVAAIGNAMIHFPDTEVTGVIMFKELFDAGDLTINQAPSKEDLDTIGHYLIEGDQFSLGETDVRKVADALGIPKMIRGLELIQTMTSKIEDGEITAKLLFDLSIIDSETYDEILAAEEDLIASEAEEAEKAEEDEKLEIIEIDFDDNSLDEADDVNDVDIL